MSKELKERVEEIAEFCHNVQWSGWMKYLFSKGEFMEDGRWIMPLWAVKRWQHQTKTLYKNLSEKEKESDRDEAMALLKLINFEQEKVKARIDENFNYKFYGDWSPYNRADLRIKELQSQLQESEG